MSNAIIKAVIEKGKMLISDIFTDAAEAAGEATSELVSDKIKQVAKPKKEEE